jgi:hypothetical protein
VPTQRPTLGLAPALPGIVLVIVIAWALAAVLILTGTLINAREIKDDVTVINNQVSPIDKDLQSVALAAQTVDISSRINTAAQPLTGQAAQIISAARRIDTSARSILNTAGSINQTVHQINGTVVHIEGTVVSIHGAVEAIGGDVGSIFGLVEQIGARVANIHRLVGTQNATGDQSIHANVQRILQTFVDLDPVTMSIDSGVAAINGRADRAIGLAAGIKSDFDQILAQVGTDISQNSILGHANSIDCSRLLNTAIVGLPAIPPILPAPVNLLGGPTQSCGR